MRISKFLAGAALASTLVLIGGQAAGATTFDFVFTDSYVPAYVGYGAFTVAADLGDGVFALDSVGAYSADFTFGTDTFTTADVATPPAEILLDVTGSPGAQSLEFSNVNPFGHGPEGGSMDLINAAGDNMFFEPPGACDQTGASPDCNQFQEHGAANLAGAYTAFEASAAPELSAWMLMMVAVGGFGAALRWSRRSSYALAKASGVSAI